jgi:hypothetical protein
MRPASSNLACRTHGKGNENLPPQPGASSPFAKAFDEIARQRVIISAWTHMQ